MSKKKKGFFSFLYEDGNKSSDESENTEVISEDSNVSVEVEKAVIENIPANNVTPVSVSGDGVFDQKFNDFFQGVIEQNNIPGIDYFEYREALEKMKSLPDGTAFQMAFDNFKIVDSTLTKETLLSSIDHYISLLTKEESDFEVEMKSETEREVTSRRQRAKDLQESNKDVLIEIENLQKKISNNQEEAISLNNEAALAEVKIGQTAKNFSKTLVHVKSTLGNNKLKISELVQETKTA